MKEPSDKIIRKQIKRLGLGEMDDVPCLVKYYKRRTRALEQQGYVRISGPYYHCHKREWELRAREYNRDMYFAVKKKPGRKYNNDRMHRKQLRRETHRRRRKISAIADIVVTHLDTTCLLKCLEEIRRSVAIPAAMFAEMTRNASSATGLKML